MATSHGTGSERRQHDRKTLRGHAYLMLAHRTPLEVRMVDISPEGAGIAVPMNLPSQLSGTLQVSIPGKPQGSTLIEVQVTVVHSILSRHEDGFLVGLQFNRVPAAVAGVIAQYMKP